MDALSSSTPASSLKSITATATSLFPPKDHLNLLKRSQLPPPALNLSTAGPNPPTSPRFSRRHHLHLSSPPHIRPQQLRTGPPSPPPPPRLRVCRNASAGYAAALLDAARREGALAAVERDACRLMRVVRGILRGDASAAEEAYRGELVRRVAEGGGFCRPLVRLVRMLVDKGQVRLVGEVMDEFQRFVDELSAAPVLLVSSAAKVGPRELRGIASEVGRATGAAKVKVKHFYAV